MGSPFRFFIFFRTNSTNKKAYIFITKFNKDMDTFDLKKFLTEGKLLKELSPETYDSVSKAGELRGDSKGKRISKQAQDLKFRDYIGKGMNFKLIPIETHYSDTKQPPIPAHFVIKDIKTSSHNSLKMRCSRPGEEGLWDMHIQFGVNTGVIDMEGWGVEVDRKTANLLCDIGKNILGVVCNPNMFLQY